MMYEPTLCYTCIRILSAALLQYFLWATQKTRGGTICIFSSWRRIKSHICGRSTKKRRVFLERTKDICWEIAVLLNAVFPLSCFFTGNNPIERHHKWNSAVDLKKGEKRGLSRRCREKKNGMTGLERRWERTR